MRPVAIALSILWTAQNACNAWRHRVYYMYREAYERTVTVMEKAS